MAVAFAVFGMILIGAAFAGTAQTGWGFVSGLSFVVGIILIVRG